MRGALTFVLCRSAHPTYPTITCVFRQGHTDYPHSYGDITWPLTDSDRMAGLRTIVASDVYQTPEDRYEAIMEVIGEIDHGKDDR